jgi:hypothetical protein
MIKCGMVVLTGRQKAELAFEREKESSRNVVESEIKVAHH